MLHAQIYRMVRSMAWANEQALTMLRDCPPAQVEGLPLLAHVLGAEHLWLCRLQSQEPTIAVWPTLTLTEAEGLNRQNTAGFAAYLERTAETDLGTMIACRSSQEGEYRLTAVDILTHVFSHGAYHRGQIARLLKPLGVQAGLTDFVDFAVQVEPAG